MLQNIRSLTNFDYLQVLLENTTEKPSATCLTEIWLKDFDHTKSMFLDGFRPLININRRKQGMQLQFLLKICTRESCYSYNLNGLQALNMRVTGTLETVTYITCLYMPPNSVNTESPSNIEKHVELFPNHASKHSFTNHSFNNYIYRQFVNRTTIL